MPRNNNVIDRLTATLPTDRSIVLVGLMGAGKTLIGRYLAKLLDRPFLDADTEIESAAGESIAEIFAKRGEEMFRDGERRVIARLLEGPPCVLATGGGAFMDPETRGKIREHGISVWLKADLEVLLKRTARRKTRPLLNSGDPRQILGDLIKKRHPVYGEADVIVQSKDAPHHKSVAAVTSELANFLEQQKIAHEQ